LRDFFPQLAGYLFRGCFSYRQMRIHLLLKIRRY